MQGTVMPHGTLSLLYTFHFYLFGLIAIASAVLFVTRKSPVAAALWLVNTMFCLAALYVMLDAQFIGAIQVLVYAGAIMVVFLFVIMLLNLGTRRRRPTRAAWAGRSRRAPSASALLAAGLRADARQDAGDAHAAARLRREQVEADRRDRADRRAAVQRVSARVRGDERSAPRRDRRRGGARQATRERRPCSLKRCSSPPCCS